MSGTQVPFGLDTPFSTLDENCFRAIAESTTDMIAVLDADGRRLYVNPALASPFGGRERLIGSDSLADVHPEDRAHLRALLQTVLESGEGRRAEYRIIDRQGRIRFFESQSNVVCNAEGPMRVVVVSRDVTERKHMERELYELKQRFISMSNHEFRTPLTTIRSSAELLHSYDCQFTKIERQEILENIRSAVVRMTGMLEHMLKVSRSAG
jgi:PAS domain S-box-containing protein